MGNSKKERLRLGVLVSLAFSGTFLFLNSAKAQDPPPAPRMGYILEVYVDPNYGYDGPNGMGNNTGNNKVAPLNQHPDSSSYQGYLYHVPYPFRTVTTALTWLKNIPTNFPNEYGVYQNHPRIPMTNQITGRTIKHVIIHCLPGIYRQVTTGSLDHYSGLPSNGESWPIRIPEGVSIQGTSALNTIFDADDAAISVFVLEGTDLSGAVIPEDPSHGNPPIYKNVFIDGITIRGARGGGPSDTIPYGAAVVIGNLAKRPLRPTISNCFINYNMVGIAIGTNSPDIEVEHSPKIVYNTIARNTIGVWNGGNFKYGKYKDAQGTIPYNPIMRPRCINNIFDAYIPGGTNLPNDPPSTGRSRNQDIIVKGIVYNDSPGRKKFYTRATSLTEFSCFEGLGDSELVVSMAAGVNVNVNFNVYQLRMASAQGSQVFFNRGAAIGNWPAVNHRSYTTAPRFDLGNFGKYMDGGWIYINDVFWYAALNGRLKSSNVDTKFDLSPHDFRIAPRAKFTEGGGSVVDAPLIDSGLDLLPSNFPIQMGSGSPSIGGDDLCGLPNDFISYQVAEYHAGDFDAEGFGNVRVYDRPHFSGQTPSFGYSDIGADECGFLIMAGYINGTTIFSEGDDGKKTMAVNLRSFYFHDLYGSPYLRPQYNYWLGRRQDWAAGNPHYFGSSWWTYVRGRAGIANPPLPGPQGSEYTYGEGGGNPKTNRFSWTTGSGTQEPAFPRNLACDISPHLMMDEHPWWKVGAALPALNPSAPPAPAPGRTGFGDSFAMNPWDATLINNPASNFNNPNLYFVYGVYDAVFGIVNPPGTWHTSYDSYMDPYLATFTWGPFGFSPTDTAHYTIDPLYGFGDNQSGGPDYVPNTLYYDYNGVQDKPIGVRFNCEVQDWAQTPPIRSNLQSFLVVNWNDLPATQKSSASFDISKDTKPKPTTVESFLGKYFQYEKTKINMIEQELKFREKRPDYFKDHNLK